MIAAGPLSVIALLAGWTATEVGRRPWIVYEVMRSSNSVTSADGLWAAFGVLVCVCIALTVAIVWLLRRLARGPLEDSPTPALR